MILESHDDAYILFIYPDLAIFVVTDKRTALLLAHARGMITHTGARA